MTELARCTWCGNMFLGEQARNWHEPTCDDNPNKQSTVEEAVTGTPSSTEYELVEHLKEIARIDSQEPNVRDYDLRNVFVLHAMSRAAEIGLDVGIRIDPKEPEWPVVYIELPTGQVSWHLPQHNEEYDGHSTGEKYLRLHKYCDAVGEL